MKNYKISLPGIMLLGSMLIAFTACGGGNGSGEDGSASAEASKSQSGLTAFEEKHGIGPVDEAITISEIDMEKVEKGKELFKTKCSACHKIEERYIGPQLDNVLTDRTPTYVMNMILNPQEMVKKHPEAKKMLQEFMSPMPNQNLSREEARAVVEYLASVQKDQSN